MKGRVACAIMGLMARQREQSFSEVATHAVEAKGATL
jgi:hypothetical protein